MFRKTAEAARNSSAETRSRFAIALMTEDLVRAWEDNPYPNITSIKVVICDTQTLFICGNFCLLSQRSGELHFIVTHAALHFSVIVSDLQGVTLITERNNQQNTQHLTSITLQSRRIVLAHCSGFQGTFPTGLWVVCVCPVAFKVEEFFFNTEKREYFELHTLVGDPSEGLDKILCYIASGYRVHISMIVRLYLKPCKSHKGPIISTWIL